MSDETARPPGPISSHDVPWQVASDVPRFGMPYRALTVAAIGEDYHVGVSIEELEPGKRSNPAHYHIFEEEHVYVLDGTLTVHIGAARHAMKAGDYVCFPAGQKVGHSFINAGSGPCSYLMIGERNPNEVRVYPDSNKIAVDALRQERSVFDMAGVRDYCDGEQID